jgi:hypothetical protein
MVCPSISSLVVLILLGAQPVGNARDGEFRFDTERGLILLDQGSDAEQTRFRACHPLVRESFKSADLRIVETQRSEVTISDRNSHSLRFIVSSEAGPGVVVVQTDRRPQWLKLRGDCQRLLKDIEGAFASVDTTAAEAEPAATETCPTGLDPKEETVSCGNKRLAASCEGGEMEACNKLGWRYLMGRGLPRDPAQAARLFERGCKAGLPKGCFNLGTQLLHGDGVPKDATRGASLIRQACNDGFEAACAKVQ